MKLEHCPSPEMAADALTRLLLRDTHWKFMGKIGLQSVNEFRGVGALESSGTVHTFLCHLDVRFDFGNHASGILYPLK